MAELEIGIHPDVDEATYHADPALGSGDVKMLVEDTPAVFRWTKDHPEEREPTRDMEIGSVAHLLALEPARFRERVVIIDARNYMTGAAKEARANAYANGQLPILESDLETALEMDRRLREQIPPEFLTGGHPECTLVWRDARTGQRCKARVDRIQPEHARLLDHKTTSDPKAEAWMRRVADNGHHIQAAHYLDGITTLSPGRWDWLWVVQSTQPPYLAGLYRPSPSWLHFGQALCRAALDVHQACQEAGEWPGLPSGVQLLEAPAWVASRFEERQATGFVARPERCGKPALTKAQSQQSVDIYKPL